MQFDDRLATTLAQPAAAAHGRAVRWRQLVELVARTPVDSDRDLFDQAIEQIRTGAASVDERVRSAAALAVAALPLPVELVIAFAADRLGVAAPILASARLTASEWKQVAAAASDECRAFISVIRSEQPALPTSSVDAAKHHASASISDVVARIERLRHSHEPSPAETPGENEPGQSRLFRWECNESGEIDWVEGVPRGALVGATIAQGHSGQGVDRTVERAFASRAPFHQGLLELPHDLSAGGRWTISGVPTFERSSGRFAGYRGVAEREGEPTAAASAVSGDRNSLRELAHEIRTPLNAIIGFAEIIAGEYLGPAGDRFRDRAGEIVAQARLLLSATEDLDFAARIHAANNGELRTDVGALVERLAGAIREVAASRNVHVEASRSTADLTAAIPADIAERLVLRMCSAVIARASEGEHLRLSVDQGREFCTVSITRPLALAGLTEDELFGTSDDSLSPSFPLRLARGLAQTAGAGLIDCERGITLLFRRA